MRRHDYVVAVQQRQRWIRLASDHIQGGPAQTAGIQATNQRVVVDEAAAADVDDQRAGGATRDKSVVNHPIRRLRQRRVQDYYIRLRLDHRDSRRLYVRHFDWTVRSDGKHAAAKSEQLARGFAADATEADDADGKRAQPLGRAGGYVPARPLDVAI